MIEMKQCYQVKIDDVLHYVYKGDCDGMPTKWITKTPWNFTISVKVEDGEIKYRDDSGNRMYVFIFDDYQYHLI